MKAKILLTAGLFSCIGGIIFIVFLGMRHLAWMSREDYRIMLSPIAERLEIEPSSDALGEYMEETFVPGMTNQEVHHQLARFGDYEIFHQFETRGEYCEIISLPIDEPEHLIYQGIFFRFCFWLEDDTLTNWGPYPG